MLPDADRVRLSHMLDAARDACAFIQDRQPDDLISDHQLGFAVMHALEIIGEATGYVSEEGRTMLPAIPWAKI